MPYRIDPTDSLCVEVQTDTGWKRLDGGCHETAGEAQAHLAALQINTEEGKILSGRLSKLDPTRHLAFGWAYTAKIGDKIVVDHSGDFIDDDALPFLEDAAYDFILDSREADEQHETVEGIGKIVESVMVTPEKMEAMGIKGDRIGWWVGFYVEDPEVWAKVADGTYPSFSIRGAWERGDEINA